MARDDKDMVVRATPQIAVALLVLMLSLWAPSPPTRPKSHLPAKEFVGEWDLVFGGGHGVAQMGNDGYWQCDWQGSSYIGHWRLQGGELVITEARLLDSGGMSETLVWKIQLTIGQRSGYVSTISTEVLFSLRPRAVHHLRATD